MSTNFLSFVLSENMSEDQIPKLQQAILSANSSDKEEVVRVCRLFLSKFENNDSMVDVLILLKSKFGISLTSQISDETPAPIDIEGLQEFLSSVEVDNLENADEAELLKAFETLKLRHVSFISTTNQEIKQRSEKLAILKLIKEDRLTEAFKRIESAGLKKDDIDKLFLVLDHSIERTLNSVVLLEPESIIINVDSIIDCPFVLISKILTKRLAKMADSHLCFLSDSSYIFTKTENKVSINFSEPNAENDTRTIEAVEFLFDTSRSLADRYSFSKNELDKLFLVKFVEFLRICKKRRYFEVLEQDALFRRFVAKVKSLDDELESNIFPSELMVFKSDKLLSTHFKSYRTALLKVLKNEGNSVKTFEDLLPLFCSDDDISSLLEANKNTVLFTNFSLTQNHLDVFEALTEEKELDLKVNFLKELFLEHSSENTSLKSKLNVYFAAETISSLIALSLTKTVNVLLSSLVIDLKKITSCVIASLFNKLLKIIFDEFFAIEDFSEAANKQNATAIKQSLTNVVNLTINFLANFDDFPAAKMKEYMVKYIISIIFDTINKKVVNVSEFSVSDLTTLLSIFRDFDVEVKQLFLLAPNAKENIKYKKFQEVVIVLDSNLAEIRNFVKDSEKIYLDKNEYVSLVSAIFQESDKRRTFLKFLEEHFA